MKDEKKDEKKETASKPSPLLAESPTPKELPPAEPGVVWFRGAPVQWF